jgi:large subunit ribosomal protein L2
LVSNNKFKRLSFGLKSLSGRNSTGKIVTRHRGSETKKNYISVDYKRRFSYGMALCINLKYDPNRTCYLALLKYFNGAYSYILAPQGLFNGYIVRTPMDLHLYYRRYKIGFCVFVYTLPVNSVFFNIELEPGKGGTYIRAAGTFGVLIRKDFNKKFIFVKLPTGKLCILT